MSEIKISTSNNRRIKCTQIYLVYDSLISYNFVFLLIEKGWLNFKFNLLIKWKKIILLHWWIDEHDLDMIADYFKITSHIFIISNYVIISS